GQLTEGVSGSSTYDYYYYHFYNWSIVEESVTCSSARTKVTVTVNDQPTAAPTGNATQKFCEGETLSDMVVTGNNIVWYDSSTGGSSLSNSTVLQQGATYYASQTVNACESTDRLAVTVDVSPVAALPTGQANQIFVPG